MKMFVRRLTVGLVGVGMAAATALAISVGPAAADGPDTSTETVQSIKSVPWVDLNEGDSGYRVVAVRCILDYLDYTQGCDPAAPDTDHFDAKLTEAVKDYQLDHELPTTGGVTWNTWERLSDDFGVAETGDDRKDIVKALQYGLNHLGYGELEVDGVYGPGTEKAVKALQEAKGIDADGDAGPLTFRVLFGSQTS